MLEEYGFAAVLEEFIENYSDPYDSVLQARDDALDIRLDLYNERIEQMNVLLEQKRQRMITQFVQMELLLGQLTAQSAAISTLTNFTLLNFRNRQSG